MSSRTNVLRLRRGRGVGFALIAIFGFLIAGFIFQPVVSAIPLVAPNIDEFEVPFQDVIEDENFFEEGQQQIMEEFPDAVLDPTIPQLTDAEFEQLQIENNQTLANFETPITSDDTVLQQIGDEVSDSSPIDPFLPQSDKIGLLLEVVTVDSSGVRTTQEFRQEFLPLEFFGDPLTGIELAGGSLEFRLWVEADPDTTITGTGAYTLNLIHHRDLNLPQEKIDQSGLITVSGITDQNGLLPIEFVDMLGQKTNVFTFDFTPENIDLFFPLNSRGLINFDMSNFKVQKDFREEFEIAQAQIFSINILNSADAIIFENIDGTIQILQPTDNSLKIVASNQGVKVTSCGGFACLSGTPHPAMGRVQVFDSNGLVLAGSQAVSAGETRASTCCWSVSSSQVLVDIMISRDATYRIVIGEPTPFDFTFTTPISQKNYEFSCVLDNDAIGISLDQMWKFLGYNLINTDNLPTKCNMPIGEITSFPPVMENPNFPVM